MSEPHLSTYIPQDRRQALATGAKLPERPTGAALFADISGFTPLTETLDRALGSRRGAEEMTQQINRVYDAVIAEVDRFGGSVLSFAGDAITCWFDDGGWEAGDGSWGDELAPANAIPQVQSSSSPAPAPAPLRAAACALAMQAAMREFASVALPDGTTVALAIKVAVASGSARRFVVGDPAIQLIDVLAGALLTRMAVGEHLADRGDVVLDTRTATTLGPLAAIGEWRHDAETGERFAVLRGLAGAPIEPRTLEAIVAQPASASLRPDTLRPWLLASIYARHLAGLGDFLTELRPAAVLFLRFAGIDYEHGADAQALLHALIVRVQQTLVRYDGTLLQLTIGDKGSYLYAVFGAPTAHEDDASRAARAALEWLALSDDLLFLQSIQIGISRGVLRVGAYGGRTRKTYGAFGDEVNLAARLMSRAEPGEALVSGRLQAVLAAQFALEPLPPMPLKGMPEPLPIFRLAGLRQYQEVRLPEPAYALPMIGRSHELALTEARLELALAGQGQVIGITAEAGMGKSRLVAEVIRLARRKGLRGYGGACQSYGMSTPYLVWGPIGRGLFELDHDKPIRRRIRALEQMIEGWAPDRIAALPLLGPLLDLPLEENAFTRTLDPQARRGALEALLLDCLKAAAREAAEDDGALVLVLEDVHWIDALSHDLLEQVAWAARHLPLLLVLAYRPPEQQRLHPPRVEALPHFTRIALGPLIAAEAEQVIRAKLAQLWPERKGIAARELLARIVEKAQGNPFYVEELLNYLRDRGLDPRDVAALDALALPTSLHTLILSRIDQLSAKQQAELKIASVIGRLFSFAWLHGAYPVLGPPEPLKADLEDMARLELTPLDTPEPELAYLFKHIVTQEVAYESLTAQARAALHEQLASYLERRAGAGEQHVDILAYHYERSGNLAKKREYLRRAGAAAAARYANSAAVDYFSRALALAPADDLMERYALLLARERIYEIQQARDAQAQDIAELELLAEALDDDQRRMQVALRGVRFELDTGRHQPGQAIASRVVELAAAIGTPADVAAASMYHGWELQLAGDNSSAATQLIAAAELGQRAGASAVAAESLAVLSGIDSARGDHVRATEHREAALRLYQALGDRQGEAFTLIFFGTSAMNQWNFDAARGYLEEGLRISRAVGDRMTESTIAANLGSIAIAVGDYSAAQAALQSAIRIWAELGSDHTYAHAELGRLAASVGDYQTARAQLEQCLGQSRERNSKFLECIALLHSSWLAHLQSDDERALVECQGALGLAQVIEDQSVEADSQCILGHILLGLSQTHAARQAYQSALSICQHSGLHALALEPTAGLARVALAEGRIAEAQAHAEGILTYLDGGGTLNGALEPLRVYLTCYQVLQASGDPRAGRMLDTAHTIMQSRMARLPEALRHLFAENVPYHRELAAAWGKG